MPAAPPHTPTPVHARRFVSPELVDLTTAWSLGRDRATGHGARHDPWCRGRHGWMLDLGLDAVLDPVLGRDGFATPGFYRFSNLDAAVGASLLERLDPGYLAEERQNDSPAIGAFLRAVVAHPDRVLAHGYVVGPERCDERIAVEGVLVRTDSELVVDPHCGPGCQCEHLLRYVEEVLGLRMPVRPHEIGRWWGSSFVDGPDAEQLWYRLWWD